jgi:general secretion pathway protein A
VCRCLLEQLPEDCESAFVLNPRVTTPELLATLCDELQISYPEGNQSNKVFIDRINARLLENHAAGRQTVLIIDEAQNLDFDVLEQLRLLTNLETNQRKLLQIILLGQPEFLEILEQPRLRQLAQRISARYHLTPLTYDEMVGYVHHRLRVAGLPRGGLDLFPPPILRRLHRLSGGIPRLVNLLCDRSLLGVYARERSRVDRGILSQAAREIFGDEDRQAVKRVVRAAVFALLFVAIAGTGFYFLKSWWVEQPSSSAASLENEAPAEPEIKPVEMHQGPEAGFSSLAVPEVRGDLEAFERLFAAWGLPGVSVGESGACETAALHGLSCLSDRGTLHGLARLDRPAVLTLYGDDGERFYAALVELGEDWAVVDVAGEPVKVRLSALERRWLGEFVLFWRPPPGYRGNLHPGDEDPFVSWLDAGLSRAEGWAPVLEESTQYDARLERNVKRFQLSRGLDPDGIIGSKTLIQLNSALGGSEPRLKAEGN